ncbi:MAG TPA: hypothetical protein VLI72_09755 [Methylibium sp.]|nr:hypothetical protein [Methylibium sp.]
MNRASLQALTWGTISAAVASAMLLAAHGDDTDAWGPERDAATSTNRPAAVPAMTPVGAAAPRREGPSGAGRP